SLRKHPLVLVGRLIPFLILDYVPYLLPKLGAYLDSINTNPLIDYGALFSFGNPWVDFIVGIFWLFVWMGAFGVFTNHFLDQWIVTNERIIDIDQKDFWRREVSSTFLSHVQNVETEVHGFFHTLFGFGTVSVETAGAEVGRLRMTGLPGPSHVRDMILKEVAKHHGAHTAPPAPHVS
ncbi:MAG: PH domain-containing protein, partial [Minisyncoccia bacterium]